ncbi:hypothetical protein MUK42_35867 [Musa troglodytarum]|uniref:Uncharacterized protein n=1 Tax=Musa troglodytarum TaxID=320322 RepID=A0A9E7FI99_9LILI|nr:hypothetical protein MUK42_35867 [Musa troglodytarum]
MAKGKDVRVIVIFGMYQLYVPRMMSIKNCQVFLDILLKRIHTILLVD